MLAGVMVHGGLILGPRSFRRGVERRLSAQRHARSPAGQGLCRPWPALDDQGLPNPCFNFAPRARRLRAGTIAPHQISPDPPWPTAATNLPSFVYSCSWSHWSAWRWRSAYCRPSNPTRPSRARRSRSACSRRRRALDRRCVRRSQRGVPNREVQEAAHDVTISWTGGDAADGLQALRRAPSHPAAAGHPPDRETARLKGLRLVPPLPAAKPPPSSRPRPAAPATSAPRRQPAPRARTGRRPGHP